MRALYTDSEPMRAWHITKQGNKRQHGNKQFQNKRHKQDKTFIIYHSLKDTTITKLHRINPVYIHLILWFIFCGSWIFPISLNCHLFFKKKIAPVPAHSVHFWYFMHIWARLLTKMQIFQSDLTGICAYFMIWLFRINLSKVIYT